MAFLFNNLKRLYIMTGMFCLLTTIQVRVAEPQSHVVWVNLKKIVDDESRILQVPYDSATQLVEGNDIYRQAGQTFGAGKILFCGKQVTATDQIPMQDLRDATTLYFLVAETRLNHFHDRR